MSLHPPVLFIGDRPTESNVDKNVAFVGTKSYRTLLLWCAEMNLQTYQVFMMNAFSYSGEPAHLAYALSNVQPHKVVTLGIRARKRLKKDFPSVEFFDLPHPSGLNRGLSDKVKLTRQLKECKKFIYGDR